MRRCVVGFVAVMFPLMHVPLRGMENETKTAIEQIFGEVAVLEENLKRATKELDVSRAEIDVLVKTAETMAGNDKDVMLSKVDERSKDIVVLENQVAAQRQCFKDKVKSLQTLIGALPAVRKHRSARKTSNIQTPG